MTKPLPLALALCGAALLAACSGAGKQHLQYDYGRAFTAAMISQADLTRPSVASLPHPLTGVEAQAIRLNVQEETTNKETGESTLRQSEQ